MKLHCDKCQQETEHELEHIEVRTAPNETVTLARYACTVCGQRLNKTYPGTHQRDTLR